MNPKEIENELGTKLAAIAQRGAFMIEGPSMIGKSWILEQLDQRLRNDPLVHVARLNCFQTMVGYEPVLDAIEDVARRKNWTTEKRGRLYTALFVSAGLELAPWIAKFFWKDSITKEDIKQIADFIQKFTKDSVELAELKEFPRSEVVRILKCLRKAIEKSGKHLVLLVDRIEELPEPGVKLLRTLVDAKVDGLSLVLSLNNESQAAHVRADISELMNVLRRQGGNYAVEGYSPDQLKELRWANGCATSTTQAEVAYRFSLDGRIGLLTDWLNAPNADLADFRESANRLAAHFAIEYGRLEDAPKELVKCLAAVFPDGLSLAQAAICIGCEPSALEKRLKSVYRVIVDVAAGRVALRNRHVLYFVRTQVHPEFVVASLEALAAKLGQAAPPQGSAITALLPVPSAEHHLLPAAVPKMDMATLLATARDDLRRGASSAAINRIDAWRQWIPTEEQDSNSELLRLEADARGQQGDYEGAILLLQKIRPNSQNEAEIAIELGEKHLRLGQQKTASQNFLVARRKAVESGSIESWTNAVARSLTVRNEIRVGMVSCRLADILLRVCQRDAEKISHRIRCLALRTIARTFALAPGRQTQAIDVARDALGIAVNATQSLRDEGNCRYALADALRHAKRWRDAHEEYRKAQQIAARTGNYDLDVHANLGMAATGVGGLDSTLLEQGILGLADVCTKTDSNEYSMLLLFKYLHAKLTLAPDPAVEARLSVESRPWTAQLLKEARQYRVGTGEKIAAIRITL